MVTPCMLVWSAVTSSINSREYCVYYIGNDSLTRQNAYFHNFLLKQVKWIVLTYIVQRLLMQSAKFYRNF